MKPTSSPAAGKKVLIHYIQFTPSPGGGEFLPLLLMEEFQKRGCSITLALNWESDVGIMAELYGVEIDLQKINVIIIKPKKRFLDRLDNILPFYRVWQLKKLVKNADVYISTANLFDFGKPAHHFVFLLRLMGDNAFIDYYNHVPPLKGAARFKRKARTFLAETILRPLLGMRSTRKILSDQREHIYPPSQYVDSIMRSFYGPFNSTVFYPPTAFEAGETDVPRDPFRVNYLGRVTPEKRVDEIVGIVAQARELSGLPLTLYLAGHLDETPFIEKLRRTAAENPWLHLPGPVYGEEKAKFLLSGAYAIHAERDEAFGISITEYLKAGLIPIVPDEGGTVEIVDAPELTYHTPEDAAKILVRLLQDETFREGQLSHCKERAKLFSAQAYMENQRRTMEKILAETD